MDTKALVLLAAVLASTFLRAGSAQRAQAEELTREASQEAAERAEELAEARKDRAEEEAERAKELAEEAAERAKERAEQRKGKDSRAQAEETEGGEKRGPQEVIVEISGGSGTRFSGTCTIGKETRTIRGEVPESFHYDLQDRQKLECEIRKRGTGTSTLKVVLTAPGTRIVQLTNAGTIHLTYTEDGDSSMRIVSSSG